MRWSPERLDQLERAIRDGRRIILVRRGAEHVVVALRITRVGTREAVVGRVPMTGEEMVFAFEEIDELQVLG